MQHNALLVPQSAVTELQGRYQVAVVSKENKVNIRSVEVGSRVDSNWIITKGLDATDRVVSEGTSKVREGATVNPTPANTGTGSANSSEVTGK